MAYWHIRINGSPWCCQGELGTQQSPALRDALLKLCCGQASRADALCLKAALAESGCATWDEIEIVQSRCEIKQATDAGLGKTAQVPGRCGGGKK
jgi:hypothetical protein